MLIDCPALSDSRAGVLDLWDRTLLTSPHLSPIFHQYTVLEQENTVQFLLDPTTLPGVITARQIYGWGALEIIFYLTRTLCYSLHNTKMKLLGLK